MPFLESAHHIGINGGNFIDVNGSYHNTDRSTNTNMINSGNTTTTQIKDSFNDYSTRIGSRVQSSHDYGRHTSPGPRRGHLGYRSSSDTDDWESHGFPFGHATIPPPGIRPPAPRRPAAPPRPSRHNPFDAAAPIIEDVNQMVAQAMKSVSHLTGNHPRVDYTSSAIRIHQRNNPYSPQYRSASAEPTFREIYDDDPYPAFPTPEHHSSEYLQPEDHHISSRRDKRDRRRPHSSHEEYDERSPRETEGQLRPSSSRHRKHETRSQDRPPARTAHHEPVYDDYSDQEICEYCRNWMVECRCYDGQDYSDSRGSRRASRRKARKREQFEDEEEGQGYDAYPEPAYLHPEEPAHHDQRERSANKESRRESRRSLHRVEKVALRESRTSLQYEEKEDRRASGTSLQYEEKASRRASRTSLRDGRHSPTPKLSKTPPARQDSTDSGLSYVSVPAPKKPEPVPYGKSRIEVLTEHSGRRSESPDLDRMSDKGSERAPSIRARPSSPVAETPKGKARAARSRQSSPTRSDAGSEAPNVQVRSPSPTASEVYTKPKTGGSDIEDSPPVRVQSASPEPLMESEDEKVTPARQRKPRTQVKEVQIDKTPKVSPAPISDEVAGIAAELQRVDFQPPEAASSSSRPQSRQSDVGGLAPSTSGGGGKKMDFVGDMLGELYVPPKDGEAGVESSLGENLAQASTSSASINSVSDSPSSSGKGKKRNVLKKFFKGNKNAE